MTDATPITVEMLRAGPFDLRHWRRLPRGGFFRCDRSKAYPRFSFETRRADFHAVTETYLVDGKIVDTLDQVAALLNEAKP